MKNAAKFFAFLLILPLLLLNACSLADPKIGEISTYAVYEQQDDGRVAAMLSVFFTYQDDDGIRDFSRMEVYSDVNGYTWIVDENKVLVNEADSVTWIGYSRLLPPAGQTLSSGTYTVTVYDHADNMDAVSFELSDNDVSVLTSIADGTFKVPVELTIDYEKSTWKVDSEWPNRQFVFFDSNLLPVGFYNTNNSKGRLESLRNKSSDADTARFYVLKENTNIAYSVPAFTLRKKSTTTNAQ